MRKDYHKGVKIQCYISEELNDKVEYCIEALNSEAENCDFQIDKITKSDFIRLSIEASCDGYLKR